MSEFHGYGNGKAPIWFVGLEEGLDKRIEKSRQKLQEHLEIRCGFGEVEDLAEATKKLGENRFHDSEKPKIQATWRWMAYIMAGLEGEDRRNDNTLLNYQHNHLGRRDDTTLLTELYPLPKPRFTAWPDSYKELIGFPDAATYRKKVQKERFDWVRELVRSQQPRFLVCYGGKTNNWEDFRKVFNYVSFPKDTQKSWRGGTEAGLCVVLAPHFASFNRGIKNKKRGEVCCDEIIEFLHDHGWAGQ